MKKIILLLSVLVALGSCQKKNYATFQKSSMPTYASEKKSKIEVQPVVETAKIEIEKVATPSSTPIMASANENDLKSVLVTTNVSSFEIPQTEEAKTIVKSSTKQSFKNKIAEKVFEKQLNKLSKASKSNVEASGWKDLNKNIRVGIILIVIGALTWWIPIIGWIFGTLAGLIGVILLILGLIKQLG